MKNKRKKNGFLSMQTVNGFTLVEILLVIAIIGILAATLYVGMGGQRDRARAHAALESIRSAFPAAIDCYMRGDQPLRRSAGGNVCNPANGFTWPALGSTCSYNGDANLTGNMIVATCSTGAHEIHCDVDGEGRCWLE